ncbi:MAG: HAD-IIIA family hydrolase [Candidatus Omnitrophica bacterium]|nr:HAD-IIIA family hydrolase [Candidatus Omnitrophota bacterium]
MCRIYLKRVWCKKVPDKRSSYRRRGRNMERRYSDDILDKAKNIKMLMLDVDGVLTDGRLIYGNYGDEIKNFNVKDGLGVFLIKKAGLKCVILTAKASKIVKRRAKQLKVDKVYQNFHYKNYAFKKAARKFRVDPGEICFVGDDLIDIPVLKRAGLAVCPPDAAEEVKSLVDLITEKKGGYGAVREVCELILKAQDKWRSVTRRYYE